MENKIRRKIFKRFLTNIHDENRCIENIPEVELDRYLGLFFVSAQKKKSKNGTLEFAHSKVKTRALNVHQKWTTIVCSILNLRIKSVSCSTDVKKTYWNNKTINNSEK